MILMIEGPRLTGKTHLMTRFFEQNRDPSIIYYKFQFAKYMEQMGIRDQETGPGIHYFSVANVLTILELNQTVFADKLLVFDRSIFSAYVWSIYRERMSKTRLMREFGKILSGELYQNCAVLYLNRSVNPGSDDRGKDYFGNFENYDEESALFSEVFETYGDYITDARRNNSLGFITNSFDMNSQHTFNRMINLIASDRRVEVPSDK